MSGDGGIFRSLARVDWLVLLVVALYALSLGAPRALYAGIAAYGAFVAAMRWRGFPVKSAHARLALGSAVMVGFITFVAAQTGGAASPMVHLYLLPVVVAAMTLPRMGVTVIFAAVALAFLSLVAGEGPLPGTPLLLTRLFGTLGPWALVAYLTHTLAGSILSARRQIEEMAEHDGLTGLLNLRAFKAALAREHGLRARDSRGAYAILLVDVDDLKALNDAHGHAAGNRALSSVSSAIRRAIRSSDMAARYGADEFAVFLPEATPEVAETVAKRIRNHVYSSLFPVGERLQRVTASVGAASYPRDGAEAGDVLSTAVLRARRDRELRLTQEPAT
ncbi:MAG TPA: diguanylate cyclase [Steroidobacteraceae bacterium]|nr:diguanylate cyclase [Steroidobacteraceae bacterium]